jgi:hypothetical protein
MKPLHSFSNKFLRRRWMAGSSPAMTSVSESGAELLSKPEPALPCPPILV